MTLWRITTQYKDFHTGNREDLWIDSNSCLRNPLWIHHFLGINWIVTARKRSWGKVMFLHLSIILFTGEGAPGSTRECTSWMHLPACTPGWTPQLDAPSDAPLDAPPPVDKSLSPARGCTPYQWMQPPRPPPPKKMTDSQMASGTHPTAMCTCWLNFRPI